MANGNAGGTARWKYGLIALGIGAGTILTALLIVGLVWDKDEGRARRRHRRGGHDRRRLLRPPGRWGRGRGRQEPVWPYSPPRKPPWSLGK